MMFWLNHSSSFNGTSDPDWKESWPPGWNTRPGNRASQLKVCCIKGQRHIESYGVVQAWRPGGKLADRGCFSLFSQSGFTYRGTLQGEAEDPVGYTCRRTLYRVRQRTGCSSRRTIFGVRKKTGCASSIQICAIFDIKQMNVTSQ